MNKGCMYSKQVVVIILHAFQACKELLSWKKGSKKERISRIKEVKYTAHYHVDMYAYKTLHTEERKWVWSRAACMDACITAVYYN